MNLWNIAKFTYKDLFRSKIMWNIPVLSFVIAVISYVAKEFAYGVPGRVATNLGLGALTLSVYGIAFFAGVTLIRSEAESRTIYLIISRPITRTSFLLGKIAGVGMFITLNTIILGGICGLILWAVGGVVNHQVFVSILFVLLESIVLLSLIVVLSMISNTALTLIFSFILLVSGHAVAVTTSINWLKQFPWLKSILDYYHWLLPAFYKFNFKDYAVYSQSFPWERMWGAFGYGVCYSLALILLGSSIINAKDFD